jgi:penicillin G amidase
VLDHPLGGLPLVGRLLNRGPFAVPGSATTILAFGGPWRGDAVDVTYGPSMRFATDAADPESTLAILPGGQSGHPFDPHYDDQLADFLAGRARPVAWSESGIARATVSTLRLEPGAGARAR